ncbi:MAG: hypothetical protein LBI82_11955 [Dysgonamonadaceae bacterium]|jgi:hypothetical protein|nr:hypothetical protein [Dysgonamonadaceae bacterium]
MKKITKFGMIAAVMLLFLSTVQINAATATVTFNGFTTLTVLPITKNEGLSSEVILSYVVSGSNTLVLGSNYLQCNNAGTFLIVSTTDPNTTIASVTVNKSSNSAATTNSAAIAWSKDGVLWTDGELIDLPISTAPADQKFDAPLGATHFEIGRDSKSVGGVTIPAQGTPRIYSITVVLNIPTTPAFTVSPSSISGLFYEAGSGPSVAQSFILKGANLTASNITITAPTNFQVSLDGTSFATSEQILGTSVSEGVLADTKVYVRLAGGLSVNSYSDEIDISGAGANATVNCSGNVIAVCNGYPPKFPYTWDNLTKDWDPTKTSGNPIPCWITCVGSTLTANGNYTGGDASCSGSKVIRINAAGDIVLYLPKCGTINARMSGTGTRTYNLLVNGVIKQTKPGSNGPCVFLSADVNTNDPVVITIQVVSGGATLSDLEITAGPPLVIAPTDVTAKSVYANGVYGDIIFKSDGTGTGQLTIPTSQSLTVDGFVKLEKEVTKKWYAMGFPFDVTVNYMNVAGDNGNGTEGEYENLWYVSKEYPVADFWLKEITSKGTFVEPETSNFVLKAGKGYVLQFPSFFNGKTITFISTGNSVVLSNDIDKYITIDLGYTMVANSSVAEVDFENDYDLTGQNFYLFNGDLAFKHYSELNVGEIKLQPFESMIVFNAPVAGTPPLSIGIETGPTGSIDVKADNGKIVDVRYYNLQGLEIKQPVENGIYIVKTTYESNAVETTKVIK